MIITLKLFASLATHLPQGAEKNQIEVSVESGTTIIDIIQAHNVPQEHCHLVLVDGVYVEPSARERCLEHRKHT